jgi:hypothetical protein
MISFEIQACSIPKGLHSSCAGQVSIMRHLTMNRFRHQKLVAALLPWSFLWAFMACVSICERESLDHSPADHSYSIEVNKVGEAPGCEECPLSYFPRATAPDRVNFSLLFQPLSTFTGFGPSTIASHQYASCDWLDYPLYDSSPPPKLLSALRI